MKGQVDTVIQMDKREEGTTDSQGTEGSGGATTSLSSSNNEERITFVKNKRKALRGKITRSINRVRGSIQRKDTNQRRFLRELEAIRSDYGLACDFHGELYSYVDESQVQKLDQWESDLIEDMHTIEEEVEDYLMSLDREDTEPSAGKSGSNSTRATRKKDEHSSKWNDTESSGTQDKHSETNRTEQKNVEPIPSTFSESGSNSFAFDSWINNLVEFQETNLPSAVSNMSVADALYKLEASKDIPPVKLGKYDGNPLDYVDFIERFKIHIHDKPHLSDDLRMVQLRMHLTGDAERALCSLGSSGSMYATAIKMLQDQFGQPSLIARAIVNKLTKGAKIPPNNRNALRDLSLDLINSIATLKRLNHFADVNANENLRKIVLRLPGYLIEKWKSFVTSLREKGDTPSVIHISDFVRQRVKAEFDPDFGDLDRLKPDHRHERSRENERTRRGIYSQQTVKRAVRCYLCAEDHRISHCPTFLDSDVNDRIQKTRDMRLCFSCLVKGHTARECRSKRACGKDGCTRTHNELLHISPPVASACSPALDRDGILPVIRGIFRGSNGKLREGNILVDSGASTSVIRRDFARALGLQGKHERLDVSVVGEEVLQNANSRRLKFWLSSLDGGEEWPIEAYELEKTVTGVPALDSQWLQSFSHLSDLSFNHKAGPIDLILGIQYSHLHAEIENRQGLPFQPIARKSVLGWYVLGPDNTKRMSTVCSVNFMEKINLEKFYDFETIGIQSPNCSCPKESISSDDKTAMEMFKASCKKVGERYEIALPWKMDPHMLPDNYPLAERRLCSLERNLLKNEDKAKMYDNAMQEYVKNKWAEPVSEESSDASPVYYLPHHGVYRPEKISTPLRIVFDPACIHKGTSLNSFLYKGPCLIGNLYGVLLRFREEVVSFVGDISKMYLQILLPESDTQVHRFLWRNLDVNRKPQIYRLLRVTFGDKPSPDMASYVILHIAEENKEEFPEAAVVLQRDRYMDDLIHSCSSPEQAVQKIQDLDKILSTGSFHIKEWYCSSETVREKYQRRKGILSSMHQ
ncbi:uncharacterized protein LOC124265089 [Haliotis rubra]|uniref:uncharacterized protein LOC124265089 n=1 Tax=Haliotis rubra TaxID=36100 RepID=UPI001EE52125|nr:uncharacterized protein LOC124265089 [Haliotis rubra]